MSTTLPAANVIPVDFCVNCEPSRELNGTNSGPATLNFCRKCDGYALEYVCTCGKRRLVNEYQLGRGEFCCADLIPPAGSCNQRYIQKVCPCCDDLAVFEPDLAQRHNGADGDSGDSAPIPPIQFICPNCIEHFEMGVCLECQTTTLIRLARDSERVCQPCLAKRGAGASPDQRQKSGKNADKASIGNDLEAGQGGAELSTRGTGSTVQVLPNELENGISAQLIELKEQLERLGQSIGVRPKRETQAPNETLFSLLSKTVGKLGELDGELVQIKPLGEAIGSIQDNLEEFIKSELKEQQLVLGQQVDANSLTIDEIRASALKLAGDGDRNVGLVQELLSSVTQLETRILPLERSSKQHERIKTIAVLVNTYLPNIRGELANALTLLKELRQFSEQVLQSIQTLREKEPEAAVEQVQPVAPLETLVQNLQSQLGEIHGQQALAFELQSRQVAALKEEVRDLSMELESFGGKSALGATKGSWFQKKESRSDEGTGDRASSEESDLPTPPRYLARAFMEIEDFVAKIQKEFIYGKLFNFLKAIPVLFDSIERNLNLFDPAEQSLESLRTGLLKSIRGWQNNSQVERIPDEDVTRTNVRFDETLHLIVGRELVQDETQNGTLARVEKPGYRLVNWLDEPIPLRRASVIVRVYTPSAPPSTSQEA